MENLYGKKVIYVTPQGVECKGVISGPLVVDKDSGKVPGRIVEGSSVKFAEGYEPTVSPDSAIEISLPPNSPGADKKSYRLCVNVDFTYPDGRKGSVSGVSQYNQLRNTFKKGYYKFDESADEVGGEGMTKEEKIAELQAIIASPKTAKKKKEAAEKELAELTAGA